MAGVGAAWRWQGQDGQPLDARAVNSMQTFFSESQPRIRALGGARFQPDVPASQGWQSFGSYMFIIPR